MLYAVPGRVYFDIDISNPESGKSGFFISLSYEEFSDYSAFKSMTLDENKRSEV
jgi:hypothetical protein